jgi:large subunit ribosomal protein L46
MSLYQSSALYRRASLRLARAVTTTRVTPSLLAAAGAGTVSGTSTTSLATATLLNLSLNRVPVRHMAKRSRGRGYGGRKRASKSTKNFDSGALLYWRGSDALQSQLDARWNEKKAGSFEVPMDIVKRVSQPGYRPETPVFEGKERILGSAIVARLPKLLQLPEQHEIDCLKVHNKLEWMRLGEIPWELAEKQASASMVERAQAMLKPLTQYELDAATNIDMEKRLTEADIKNDHKSSERLLDQKLYLIVKMDGDKHEWQFPQGAWEEGETLRQTAERELREVIGRTFQAHFVGHAPIGHVEYDDVKTFFFHAIYLNGLPRSNLRDISDYAWVTKEEMREYFSPDLMKKAEQMLW